MDTYGNCPLIGEGRTNTAPKTRPNKKGGHSRTVGFSPEQAAVALNSLVQTGLLDSSNTCGRRGECTAARPKSACRPQSAGNLGNGAFDQRNQQLEHKRNPPVGQQKPRQSGQYQRPYTAVRDKEYTKPYAMKMHESDKKQDLCNLDIYKREQEMITQPQKPRRHSMRSCVSSSGETTSQNVQQCRMFKKQSSTKPSRNSQQKVSSPQLDMKCNHKNKSFDHDKMGLKERVYIHKGTPTVIELRSLKSPPIVLSSQTSFECQTYEADVTDSEDEGYNKKYVGKKRSCELAINASNVGDGLTGKCSVQRDIPLKCSEFINFNTNTTTTKKVTKAAVSQQQVSKQFTCQNCISNMADKNVRRSLNCLQKTDDKSKSQCMKSSKVDCMGEVLCPQSSKWSASQKVVDKNSPMCVQETANKLPAISQTFEVPNTDTIVITPGKTTKIEVRPPSSEFECSVQSTNTSGLMKISDVSDCNKRTDNGDTCGVPKSESCLCSMCNKKLGLNVKQAVREENECKSPGIVASPEVDCSNKGCMHMNKGTANNSTTLINNNESYFAQGKQCANPSHSISFPTSTNTLQRNIPQYPTPMQQQLNSGYVMQQQEVAYCPTLPQYQPQPSMQQYQLPRCPPNASPSMYVMDNCQSQPYCPQFQTSQLPYQNQTAPCQWSRPSVNACQNNKSYQVYQTPSQQQCPQANYNAVDQIPRYDYSYMNNGRTDQQTCGQQTIDNCTCVNQFKGNMDEPIINQTEFKNHYNDDMATKTDYYNQNYGYCL